ncbi:MAG: hypothetical protein IJ196_05970 [Prevotella sp.]|nr:hypothetical protein [Prevotella sp.]
MNKEEKILESRLGRDHHFTVPDGYFEQFNARIMEQLPEREARIVKMRPTAWRRLRPVWLAAACVCGIVFSAGIYRHVAATQQADMVAQAQYDSQYYYDYDEAADCMMLDNDDIYAYVASY